jgi:hypothetical protein
VDEITGVAPLGKVRVNLDIKDGNGNWQTTDIKPVTTPGGVITFPGLERRAEVIGQPPRRYRIRLDAELYRPLYPAGTDGYEFDAFPYNDDNPPQKIASEVQDALLKPATNYPFSTHLLVLRGYVRDSTGVKLRDVFVFDGYDLRLMSVATVDGLVNEGRNLVVVALVSTNLHIRIFDANGKRVIDKAENQLMSGETLTTLKKQLNPLPDESGLSPERKQKIIRDATSIAGYTLPDWQTKLVLTDERGEFAFPIYRVKESTSISIFAEDRSGIRKGMITVNIPENPVENHPIVIN